MKTATPQDHSNVSSSCHWQLLKNRLHKNGTVEGSGKGLQLPRSRQRHSACRVGEFVYVFCGKDGTSPLKDIWKYHIYNQTWELVEMRGGSLPLLQGHTAIAYKRLIVIFGGTFNNNVNDIQLWIYNTDLGHLREVWGEAGSIQPLCRRDHSAVVHHNGMYVFGGFKDPTGASQELWAFNMDEEEWTELTHLSHLKPSGRYGHMAVVADNAMWIFGGTAGLAPCTDFWKYSFSLHQWTKLKCVGGPPSLSGHSMCVIHRQMVVVGGNCKGKPTNDVWIYRFDTNTWQKVTTRAGGGGGTPLPAVSFHTCVAVSAPDSKHQPSTDRALSTPHLKPSTTLPLPDRFLVRPRTSPSVLEDSASGGAYSDRSDRSHHSDRSDRAYSDRSDRSGLQETQVLSLEERDSFSSSVVVDLRNTNSSHRADPRIHVSLKECLVSDSPDVRGVYESCFPFSPRCEEDADRELQAVKHAPLSQRSDAGSLAPDQTGSPGEGSHSSVTIDVIDVSDSPVLKATKHGVKSPAVRKEMTFWNDLFIEDLESSDDGGLDEIKIYYPSKNTVLPLCCPDPTTTKESSVTVEDASTQQWRSENSEQRQRSRSPQSHHGPGSSLCQAREAKHLGSGTERNVTSTTLSVPDQDCVLRPQLHSRAADDDDQGDVAKPDVPCRLNPNLPVKRDVFLRVPNPENQCSPRNKDLSAGVVSPSPRQLDQDRDRDVLDSGLDSLEAETSFIDGGLSAQMVSRSSSGSSSDSRFSGKACTPADHLSPPRGRGEAASCPGQRSSGVVDGAKEEMRLEEPFLLVLGGKMEEMVSIMPKPIAVWKGVFL